MKRFIWVIIFCVMSSFAMKRGKKLKKTISRHFFKDDSCKAVLIEQNKEGINYFKELFLHIEQAKKTQLTAGLKAHLYNLKRQKKLEEAGITNYVTLINQEIKMFDDFNEEYIPEILVMLKKILEEFSPLIDIDESEGTSGT